MRKRLVITGSTLRPQSQQQKAGCPPLPPPVFLKCTRDVLPQAALCAGLLDNVWRLFDSKQLRSKV